MVIRPSAPPTRLALVVAAVLEVEPSQSIREQRDGRIVEWGLAVVDLVAATQADPREPLLDGAKELPGVQAVGIGVAMSGLRIGPGPFQPERAMESERQRPAGQGVQPFELLVDGVQADCGKRLAGSQGSLGDEVLHVDEVEIASQRDGLSRGGVPHPGEPLGDRVQAPSAAAGSDSMSVAPKAKRSPRSYRSRHCSGASRSKPSGMCEGASPSFPRAASHRSA